MTSGSNYQETARKNAETITRSQTIRAMEHLIIGMGDRSAYIDWLNAMPEDTTLSVSGGISQTTIKRIASDDEAYNKAVAAFAGQMGPVLMQIAAEK